MSQKYDAVIVGAGPNGLSAAITIARTGRRVLVLEAADQIGGGCRTDELTLPGFKHDVCSAIHSFALASPAFRNIPLESFGVEFVQPDIPLAQPLDGGDAAFLHRSIERTAAGLGVDEAAYCRMMEPLVRDFDKIMAELLGPIRLPPRHPIASARFGLLALNSAAGLAKSRFRGEAAKALFSGVAAHSILPLETRPTAAFGLMLVLSAHVMGWPFIRGGSQMLAESMANYLRGLDGEIETGRRVTSMADLPPANAYLFDVTPRQLLDIAGESLPWLYRKRLERYRYGPGVFKMDFALSAPPPWTNPECSRAGTLHLGGTMHEIAASERRVSRGEVPSRPLVLFTQPSVFDPTRAPEGKHTAWAYCHVPSGCDVDMSEAILGQIERFAPGFRDTILATHTINARQFEAYNNNYIGGDINGGVQDLRQLFTRPVISLDPYRTPNPSIYICSSSTPPGGGVHGLCGYYAARSALRRLSKNAPEYVRS